MYALRFYSWLERSGRFVLDEPLADLLRALERRGSLPEAAREVGLPSPRARQLLAQAGRGLGAPILTGGGTRRRLTPPAKRALREFEDRNGALHIFLASGGKRPFLSVDGIVVLGDRLVLVRRKHPPHQGALVLPGGIVEYGERLEDAVVREVKEETGLRTRVLGLVGAYSDPRRDPRGHNVSTAWALAKAGGSLRAGDDAAGVEIHALDALPPLGFDHGRMVVDFLRLREGLGGTRARP